MHSTIVAIALAGALSLTGVVTVVAQDATPETVPNLFADLGLPELTITASETGLSVDQTEIPAGRYLVNLVNETADPELSTGFVRLDEGETLEDLSYADEYAAGTPELTEEPPVESYVFLYDNYITGGPSAISPQVVVDLPAGSFGVWPDDPFASTPAAALAVTGDPAAEIIGPEPEAAATIVMEGAGGEGFRFSIDGDLRTGPQIVKVLNASDQPHFVIAVQYPEPVTQQQVMDSLMFDQSAGATPPSNLIDESKLTTGGASAAQGPGTTQWVVMDLSAGQAILLCFISDPEAGGVPHAFEGMIQVVDVVA